MLLLHMMGFELTPYGHQHFSTAANIYIAEKKKREKYSKDKHCMTISIKRVFLCVTLTK